MDVSKEILDFLTGIHDNENQPENRKEKMFDRAFELAYKDMATHTVAYKKEAKEKYFYKNNQICNDNRKAVRACIKSFVKNEIFGGADLKKLKDNLAKEKFDRWHEESCEKFSEFKEGEKIQLNEEKSQKNLKELICHEKDNIFTIGQSQKLINMMIKYLYIYNKCEEEKERVLKSEDLDNIENHAHAAIDNYVMEKVFGEKYKETKWSKLKNYKYKDEDNEDSYEKYKKEIGKKAKEAGKSPFMWELKNWPFNEK